MTVVGPFGPRGEPRQVEPDLAEKGAAVDSVESVLEIDLEDDVGDMTCVTVGPLPDSVHSGLSTERDSNSYL